jgi:murein L,D-transpeptidase YcbB/YkuD
MKCSLVRGLIAGSLISLTFLSCSRHNVAQTKNYQEILYGSADKTEAASVQPVTEIQIITSKKAEPILIDTLKFLGQNSLPLFTDNYFNTRIAEKTNFFYRSNKLQTKWLLTTEPSQLYYSLVTNLKNAAVYGLNPDDYSPDLIEKAVKAVYDGDVSNAEVVALDVRITELYFLFTTHLSEGKIRNAGYSDKLWLREQHSKSAADVAELVEANDPKDLEKIFDNIQPANEQYKRLQAALVHYRNLERYAVESLPAVSVSGKLSPGMRSKAIPLIRKRLSQFDLNVYPVTLDSLTGQWDTLLYDRGLVQGVIAFQIVHGLEPDGVLGPMTVNYLNKSLRSRVEAIAVNIDRIRWTPELKNDSEYIIVNVPEYKLYIYDKNKEVFEMRVVVGAVENPTPVFNDHINHIVFSPTWTVPVSIIKNEIIPRLISNPDYYTERNYVFYKDGQQIDPASEPWGTTQPHQYRIVQQSGGDNSLGRVKFGMSNSMRIYLHDTPSQRLFAKEYRALSHGCIRLDEPAKFAEYLLRENSGWDREKIKKEMSGDKASTIMLKKDYQVRIQYCTAWVSEDGRMNFREDIYGHDHMQLQELNRPAVKTSGAIAGL